jgi:hypothetical protein
MSVSSRYDTLVSQKPPTHAFRSALCETVVILIAWVLCCCWVVGYCGAFAFPSTSGDAAVDATSTTFGFPSWVVWGIAVPWVVTNLFTIAFCFLFLRDDDAAGDDDA